MNKTKLFLTISIVCFQVFSSGTAYADLKSPKRGDCYNYSQKDTAPIAAKKESVPCSYVHTQETYRIAQWPANKNPYEMSNAKRLKIAQSLCLPFSNTSQYFNYFNFYLPTKEQWSQGKRWLRCDAAVKQNDGSWAKWRGLILDIR